VKYLGCLLLLFAALFTQAQTTTSLSQQTSNNTSGCASAGSPLYCQAGVSAMSDANGTFNAAPGNVSKQDVHSLLYSGNSTKIFAYYMPWFCMNAGSSATGAGTNCQSHIQVGYNANDYNTVHGQLGDMQARGFDGVVVPYYSNDVIYADPITKLVRDEATSRGMYFALMEDEGAFKFTRCPQNGGGVDQTACIVQAISDDMDYMDANYFNRSAYLKIDPATNKPSSSGRPYLGFFICEECFTNPAPNWSTIWTQVRAHAKTLSQGEPLFIFRNPAGFTHPQTNGAFSWMAVNSGDPYALNYSNYFYDQSILYPALETWGASWKGFDDSAASWTQHRYVGQQCGRTWLQVFATASKDYGTSRQLPFLGVNSWNDYEEGTEIETGIDNCLSLTASVSGSTLSWQPSFSASSGSEETILKYIVYELGTDGDTLTQRGSYSTSTHSVDLTQFSLPAAKHTLYVQAVGRASILNKMSAPVTYDNTATAKPILSLSPTSLSFGSAPLGMVTSTKTATLKNSGTAAATITSIATTGDFTQTTTCGTSLAAGASCTITIAFKATATGTRTGKTTIVDSAAGSPHVISLSGTGTTTCTLPSSSGIHLCNPANGTIQTSPVRAWASTRVSGTFAHFDLYIDGVKRLRATSTTINQTYSLTKGSHKIIFYAYNTAGTRWSSTSTFTVK
jgi:hypothetical protein